MISSILLLLGAAVAYVAYNVASGLARNIAKAKNSGLPYYIAPMSPINVFGQLLGFAWIPIYKMLLPRKYWEEVMTVFAPEWQYHENYAVFEKLGHTFFVVSPGKSIMYTANAEAIHQITSKREAFPKPTENYKVLAMYGENVVTTEGAVWRMHRKITSTSFNEKNAALVFGESINQTKGMITQWLGGDGKGNKTIKTIEDDTMSLMLHIIGYVGFGLKLLWSGQTLPPDTDPRLAKYSSLETSSGYSLSFRDSIAGVLHSIIVLVLTPRWLLRILPFQTAKTAVVSENNMKKYMDDFLHDKVEDVKQGKPEEGMNIMGMLVRTSYGDDAAPNGSKAPKKDKKALLDSEIIGNAFVMMVAGHETTANTMHFTLLQLATNPEAQRLVQRDVDNIFGNTDPHTWDYESSVNPLLASYVAACMNETLRMMPPVVDVPKKVSPGQDQVVMLDGEKHVLPSGTHIGLVMVAAQRNPQYWPSKPSKISGADNDIDDYIPERWYRQADASENAVVEDADSEDFGGFAGPDTSSQLFRPVRGSYIPFSDGARSCLGRRIAQVELIAALSVIFQKYSLELAVDEWASDAEVESMSREQRRELYQKAQDNSRQILKGATSLITLKLHGNKFIPVRLVPRGEERFVDWLQ